MKKTFLFTLLVVLSVAVLAADKILYQNDFTKPLSKNTVSGRLKYELLDMGSGKALSFLRNDSLHKGASSSLTGHLSETETPKIIQFNALLQIGSKQPNGRSQVSSRNIIRLQNANGKKYLDFIFSTKRYNSKRTVSFSKDGKLHTAPVNFPIDKYLKLNIIFNEDKGLWRGIVMEGRLKIFDSDWLKVKSPFTVKTFRFICQTNSSNDGLNNAIANIKIEKITSQNLKSIIAKLNADANLLYQNDFMSPLAQGSVAGSLKYELRPLDTGSGKALSFLRNDSLHKSASAVLTAHLLSGAKRETDAIEFNTLLQIGSIQPNGKSQVSSRNIIRLQNANGKKHLDLIFSTKRYNRKRTISFTRDGKLHAVPVNFPVNKYFKVKILVDMKTKVWRGVVTESGMKIFDTDWVKIKTPFTVKTFKFFCQTASSNDGLNNAIADIKIKKLTSKEWQKLAIKKNSDSCSTLPRAYKEINPGQYNSSFGNWCGDNLSDRMALGTPAAAEARAAELADVGISSVLYNGRHFRSSYVEEFPDIRKFAKISADACRKYSIEMVDHHDPTIISYRAYPFLLANLDWTQRDLRTGESSFWFCPINDDFQKFFLNYINLSQKNAKIAGYMIDELAFNSINFCGCDSCRKKFKKETGLDIPVSLKSGSQSALEIKFRGWSRKKLEELSRKLLATVQKSRADSFIMTYCSDYSDPHFRGDLTKTVALTSSFVGWENMIYNPLNSYRSMCRTLKNRNSYGDFYDIPVWSLNREQVEPVSHYLAWAMCQGTRHSIWYGGRLKLNTPEERAFFKNFNAWKKRMPHRYARYLTDVGVLFSQQTKNTNKNRSFAWTDSSGIMDMLIVNNRQYEVILDGNLFYPGYLKKYRVLFIPSQASLSNTQCRLLTEWVKNGGTAIITGKTSLYDENSVRRPDLKLGKAMNLKYNAYRGGKVNIKSQFFGNGAKLSAIDLVSLINPSKSTVLATAVAGDKSWPFIISTKRGRGHFIYVAGQLGNLVYELEARNRRVYRTVDRPKIENIIVKLYDFADKKNSPLRIEAPRNVVGIANQLMDGKGKGDIYVHLYNFTGKNVKYGDKAQYGVPENIKFPLLTSDIKIKVDIPCETQAVFQSPKLSNDIVVKGVKQNNSTEFIVPGKLLKAYGQLKISSTPLAKMAIIQPPMNIQELSVGSLDKLDPDISPLYYPAESTVKFFKSKGKKQLPVIFDKTTIIAKDAWELTKTETKYPLQEEALIPVKEQFFDNGSIACGKVFKQNMPWAREVYQDEAGVEITVASILPVGDNKAGTCSYVLYVPIETLKGMTVSYFYGMHRSGRPMRRYTFTGKETERKYFISSMRHGQFTGGKVDFMMDFCPNGIWGIFNEDQTTTYKAHVERRGEYYAFRVANNRARYGRKFTDKVIILKGRHDLKQRHPMRRIHYGWSRPADRRIQFGIGKRLSGFKIGKNISGYDLDFTMQQLQKYSPQTGYGWIDSGNAKVFTPINKKAVSIYDQGIAGSGNVKYRIDHNNGLGILNVILSGANGAIKGTVTIDGNNYNYDIPQNGIKTVAIPVLIKNKSIEFSIDGNFLLCGLVFQPLANDTEDFIFTRSYWKTGTPPWQILQPESINKEWKFWNNLPFQKAKFPPIKI